MLKGATKLPCIAASSFMSPNYLNELLKEFFENYYYFFYFVVFQPKPHVPNKSDHRHQKEKQLVWFLEELWSGVESIRGLARSSTTKIWNVAEIWVSLILTLLINQKLFDSLKFLKFEIFFKKFFLFSNFETRFIRGPLSTRKKTSKY